MKLVNVFVSSTCYDLSQLRRDLYDALSHLGHNSIMSEFNSFPVDPSIATVDNCIKQVNETADIMVLIIGGRYGSILPSGKSITNLEYSTARQKKIPIYTFIKEDILTLLPIYENNKTADFSSAIDTVKIFDFVNQVKEDSKWYFPFLSFQDIIQVLKTQFSYLFNETLFTHTRLLQQDQNSIVNKISGKAIEIMLAKEAYWEYAYFAQVLQDHMLKSIEFKYNYEYQIILKSAIRVESPKEFFKVILEQQASLGFYIKNIGVLINKALIDFFAPKGTSSNLEGLYYCAETFSDIYQSLVNHSIYLHSISCDKNQENLRDAMANLTSDILKKLWEYPAFFYEKVLEYKNYKAGSPEPTGIFLKIELSMEAVQRFDEAIDEYSRTLPV